MPDPLRPILFHNPACGTSRTVLRLLREWGHEPEIVEYLRTGWDREQLRELLAAMRVGAGGLLRRKEKRAAELGLLAPDVPDETVFEAMLLHPVLVERPIVRTRLGTVLARPPERLSAVLE